MSRNVGVTVVAATLWLCGCGYVLGPKATLGPGAIVRGRALYNDVITHTNNEQTLKLIVRARYGEPAGMLSVASVTANMHTTATTASQFGIGPTSNYSGNITPLSLGLAYEENPTIAYTPVQGERYAKSFLSPVGLDVLVLLLGIEHPPDRVISMLIKQINGLRNPMYGSPAAHAAFQSSIDLLAHLEEAGLATWASTATTGGAFALVLHDYAPGSRDAVLDLLGRWGLPRSLAEHDRDIALPLKLAFGRVTKPELNLQTRSVHDLIELAARAVEVPPEDAALATGDHDADASSPLRGILRVHSSPGVPPVDVLVATRHRGHWFYVAADDASSKLTFRFLQELINMRLVEGVPQTMPTLTIPVSK